MNDTLNNNHLSTPEPNLNCSTNPEPTMSPKGIFRKTNLSSKDFSGFFKHIHLILIYPKKKFIQFLYDFYLINFVS
jgi:hypothetical protein